VPAPGPNEWGTITDRSAAYSHVSLRGRFLHDRETRVQAITELGPGFWIMTPLVETRGFVVLVNRGFVPAERAEPATRPAGQPPGPVTVTGLLRITEPGGGFLRRNDPQSHRWYSRDVAAIARNRGLSNVAPYFVDADRTPNPGGYPIGGLTVVTFRNAHLQYAVTWFVLALMAAGGLIIVIRHPATERRP
jgi:surfeit locus 1 family protein